jgi:hypothetical protein
VQYVDVQLFSALLVMYFDLYKTVKYCKPYERLQDAHTGLYLTKPSGPCYMYLHAVILYLCAEIPD